MKNKFNLIHALFLLSLSVSCKKQLDLLPTDTIPPAVAFGSVTDLQKGLEGVYLLNTGSLNRVYIGSILADEVKMGANNSGQGQLSYEWQYTSNDELSNGTEYLSDFAAYYSMIDAINKELASIGGVTPNNATETALKNRIDGELVALRGIAHFELLIRFMSIGYDPGSPGVPIMLQSDLLGQPARAKAGDVITQVRADLTTGSANTAIPNAPDDLTRLNQATIAAYQARVGLLTGEWDSVIVFAEQALRLSGKTFVSSSNFAGYWSDANDSETLWKYSNQATPLTYWAASNLPSAPVYYSASNKLISEFDESGNDIRFNVYFKSNPGSADSFLINKYPGSAGTQVNDVKLVRVAELYLDIAEAFARENNPDSARYYLDKLREARILANADLPIFSGQPAAIQAASDERFRELCFEGFRFFDLKRNSMPVVRANSDVPPQFSWNTLPVTDHHFALPIPNHEIDANPNMKQNPGY